MFLHSKYKDIFLVFISCFLYFLLAYNLDRTQFYYLSFLWFLLFLCFYLLTKSDNFSFKDLVGISLLFRLIFLFATPNLSQDFYRFIWDGNLMLKGLNPYLSLPETFIQQVNYPISNAQELYAGMGELNGSHYTNYPPINQLNFLVAALFGSNNIFWTTVALRIQIILADIGILYFGKKLLSNLNLPVKNIFWYILNPFIIIEMTGNLHFEPVMLFFLVWGLYQLQQQKWISAAILLGLSVSVKLIPLLFLPLFFQWFAKGRASITKTNFMPWKSFKFQPKQILQLIVFYVAILLVVVLLFLPFYSSELIFNYSNSVGLWFRSFEFNASFYYIFRAIGYLFRGYNEIAIIGKIMPIMTVLFLLFMALFRKNYTMKELITCMLFGLCFYYFLSTTVHPWYLATPLILCVFTRYRFPLVWTCIVILSYQAYSNTPWKENLYYITFEYFIVYAVLFYEIRKIKIKKAII